MSDLATIPLRVNTTDLQRGNKALETFKRAATEATKVAALFSTSNKEMARAAVEATRAIENVQQRVRQYAEAQRRNQVATQAASLATARQSQELQSLLSRIGPVNRALNQLEDLQQNLSGFSAVEIPVKETLQGIKTASDASSVSLSENANSMADNVRNAKALAGSLTPARIGVLGVAGAAGLLAYQFYRSATQAEQLRGSLASGNGYSGLTATSLLKTVDAAHQAGIGYSDASEALKSLIDAGVPAGASFEQLTVSVANFADKSGVSLDQLAQGFASIANDPSKGILALDEKYHFLTATQYQHIAALQEEGKYTEALAAANQVATEAMAASAEKMKNSLGTVSHILSGLTDMAKGMWDAIEGMGRAGTTNDELQSLTRRRDSLQARLGSVSFADTPLGGSRNELQEQLNFLNVQIRAYTLQADIQTSREQAASDARARHNQNLKDAVMLQRGLNEGLTSQEKREQAITELNQMRVRMNKAAAANPQQNVSMSDADYKQRMANIQHQYRDPQTFKGPMHPSPAGDTSPPANPQLSARQQRDRRKDNAQNYVLQMAEKRQGEEDEAVMSDRQARRELEKRQLRIGWLNSGGTLDEGGYKKQAKAAESYYSAQDALRKDWQKGAQKGWADFADSAADAFSSAQQVAQAGFNGLAGMMTSLVTTGRSNIKEFGVSMLKMIVEVINKLLVAYALQMALGWIAAGTAAAATPAYAGATGSMGLSTDFHNYDDGGFTGTGGKYQPAGIVHKGEFVFTKEATDRIGVASLFDMMRGYADGGAVDDTGTMYGMQNGVAGGINVQTSVTVNTHDNQQSASGQNAAISRAWQQTIDLYVREGIQRETRPGGIIWQAGQSR